MIFGDDGADGGDGGGGDDGDGGTGEQPTAARDRLVDALDRRESLSTSVLEAVRAVPRHEFVPEAHRDAAYEDRPLPIGGGQTISAPHVVALMADRLALESGDRVLEVGTGCGYHAAVTAELVGPERVFSVEYDTDLARTARDRLDALGEGGVSVRIGDGREGWPEQSPYDAAYFTCAVPSIPDAAVDQLRAGGRIIAPVGTARQELVLAELTGSELERERLGGVRFVRIRGE